MFKHPSLTCYQQAVDVSKGLTDDDPKTKYLAERLNIKNVPEAQQQMKRLYDLFIATDATQVEINPLVETNESKGSLTSYQRAMWMH